MGRSRTYTLKEFKRLLVDNGYQYKSCNGSHFKYVKGSDIISINKDVNKMVARRLIKEHNLIV